MSQPNILLSSKEVAKRLGVCTETVRRWAKDGTLPYVRIGKRLMRFKLADVINLEAGAQN